MLYEVFHMWAKHMQARSERQDPLFHLPTSQQLTTVCRLLCKRAEYAQALALARLVPGLSTQNAAEHAGIVFEAARAAGSRLDTDALRIVMARCLPGGTPPFLKCCSQVSVGIVTTTVCTEQGHSLCSLLYWLCLLTPGG